ncbi:prepilin-type N-terminal cleavage/methylation domain-containing protein [Candidatus Parcubacteria bacterium]|nr:prepilin-type N-terminal cleavage/methylation domain-containing protein [Candidatus Parcubacteria bacterium]
MRKFLITCTRLTGENKQGFTLIELTVSVAIIAIISTMALANFGAHDKKNKIDLAAYKLASDIRKVQSYALSLKELGGKVPDRGWGIYFNDVDGSRNKYIVFADGDNTGIDNCKYDGAELLAPEIKFLNGVEINDLKLDVANSNKLVILFEPPDSRAYVCKNTASCSGVQCLYKTAKIILSDSEGVYTRTVKVNKFGLVDVE